MAMDNAQTYLEIAFEEPWLFVCLAMFIAIYRICKFLSVKFFDDDKGIINNYVRRLESNTTVMQERIGDAFKSINHSDEKVDKMESNIIDKLDSHKEEIIKHIKGNE